MINNFKQIQELLSFNSSDDFYFIQLLKRKKDNPDLKTDTKVIDNYFLYSNEDLLKLESRIIDKCEKNNARAYIRLNVRSLKKVGLYTLKIITDFIIQEDYKAIKRAYDSACGQYSNEKDNKKWIVDLDPPFNEFFNKDLVIEFIKKLHTEIKDKEYKILATLPTKSGFHIISNPFNFNKFGNEFIGLGLGVEVQKDSPTNLYIP